MQHHIIIRQNCRRVLDALVILGFTVILSCQALAEPPTRPHTTDQLRNFSSLESLSSKAQGVSDQIFTQEISSNSNSAKFMHFSFGPSLQLSFDDSAQTELNLRPGYMCGFDLAQEWQRSCGPSVELHLSRNMRLKDSRFNAFIGISRPNENINNRLHLNAALNF